MSYANELERRKLAELFISYGATGPSKYRNEIKEPEIKLIDVSNIDVNKKDGGGATPLHRAAEGMKTNLVASLIAAGADVNVVDKHGNTPLHLGVKYPKHYTIARLLVEAGANTKAKNSKSQSPLFKAIEMHDQDNFKIAELLIDNGADFKSAMLPVWPGETPLQRAVKMGHADLAFMLVSRGSDVNATNVNKMTIFHRINAKNWKIVTSLLEYARDINALDKNLRYAPLHYATQRCTKEAVQCLLDAGANIDVRSKNNETPLHIAVERGRIEMIRFLIDNNADVNAQDKYGDTPLHKACSKIRADVVGTLLVLGADPTVTNKRKETPLQVAVRLKRTNIIEFFDRYSGAEE